MHDVHIDDIEPKRSHVFGDLVNAGACLIIAALMLLFAVYLRGVTMGVAADAQNVGKSVDWLLDVPASLLRQLVIIYIVVSVLIQSITQREWYQSAIAVGSLLLGFAAAWGTSAALTTWGDTTLINTLLSAGTIVGTTLLPDFYAALGAFLTVAGPSRARTTVKWGWSILIATAIIFVITSWSSVTGVIVSILLGRFVGLLIRFIFGTINTGAWGPQIISALRSIGLHPVGLERRAGLNTESGVLLTALDDDLVENSRIYDMYDRAGQHYIVSVLDNQLRYAGYLSQIWQLIKLKSVAVRKDRSAISAMHHHLSMLLGLRQLGLTTLEPYGVADYGESSMLVFHSTATPTACDPRKLSDDQLVELLQYVQHAHDRGYTHRRITLDTLAQLRDDSGNSTPRMFIAGWQNGDAASSFTNEELDNVQILALYAALFGIERTIRVARRVWDVDTLISLIPFIQRAAVAPSTRSLEGWNKNLLSDLRKAISQLAPEEVSENLEQVTLSRFSVRSFIGFALLVVAMAVIVTQLKPEEMINAVTHANLWLALVVILFSLLAWVGSAITLGGFMNREKVNPIGLMCSQMAAGFTAVSMPAGIGPAFVNLQFLRKNGYRNTVATAIMSAVWAVQAATTVVLLIIIGIFTGRNTLSGMVPTNTLIIAIAIVSLIVCIAMAIPPIRRKVTQKYLPLLKSYARSLIETLTQPKELTLGVIGAVVLNLATGFGFWAALCAFGFNMNPIETTFIFLLANTLGSAVPTPGGLGAVEAALSVAFTAVGVPSPIALSATIVYRVAFYWLRIPVGALAMRWLDRHDMI
ncbi:lysylphosphatidylglycerol synthase transmembrane domain-containing protein [Bifidobacterium dolichotidis]|nr:lysylphosphatidylglycerol synthase transmembrane domain-containing protein [Bifidobacterium dolichotidis]